MREKEAIKRTRDGLPTQEYEVWHSMRSRCINPNRSDYHLYGGRGVRCDLTFEDFLAEVGPRPSDRHYLVMKDKDGHYAKGNIKWVPLEQWRRGKPLSAELRLKYQQTKAFHKLTGKRKGTSRFVGVCWYSSDCFWHAQIAVAGRGKSLGRYTNEVDAARAYDEAARRYHGPNAVCNFPCKPCKKSSAQNRQKEEK
jgi:hypothetical protein